MQNLRKPNETGRSMLEMLGVLAIVGVLFVGGVGVYGVAMKKHKANELLHQASMLATTISAQAMTNDGNLPSAITSFGNSSYGTFSSSVTTALEGKGFTITISGIDDSVCEQLKKSKGGIVQDVECVESATSGKEDAQITYYKNLATTEAEGKKSPTGGKEKVDPCESVTCESGQECIGGACAEVNPNTIDGCSKNADCDDWCETNGGGEKCYCSINADCTEDDSACWENFTGQCAVATTQSGVTGGYTVSADDMTWWGAVNFCKAHNKSLVSLADLGITGGYQDDAHCNTDCTGTFTWSDLMDKVGSGYYWVTDAASYDLNTFEWTSGTNNNSCEAFYVNLYYGVVASNSRYNFYSHYALCE